MTKTMIVVVSIHSDFVERTRKEKLLINTPLDVSVMKSRHIHAGIVGQSYSNPTEIIVLH